MPTIARPGWQWWMGMGPSDGGVMALDRFGNVRWIFRTQDHNGDGAGDGVFSSPTLCDVDGDGKLICWTLRVGRAGRTCQPGSQAWGITTPTASGQRPPAPTSTATAGRRSSSARISPAGEFCPMAHTLRTGDSCMFWMRMGMSWCAAICPRPSMPLPPWAIWTGMGI